MRKWLVKLYKDFVDRNPDVFAPHPNYAPDYKTFPYSEGDVKSRTSHFDFFTGSTLHSDLHKYQQFNPQITQTEFKQEVSQLPFGLHGYNVDNLKIELSQDSIEKTYQQHGVIQLREVPKKKDVLVIGCGNDPLTDDGGMPCKEESSYRSEHSHSDAVSIDPDLGKNPTFVAAFGERTILPLMKGKKFEKIVFEGFGFTHENQYALSDLKQLLASGGTIQIQGDPGVIDREISYEELQNMQSILEVFSPREKVEEPTNPSKLT
ncbi:Uncharacterised protein [Legionella lansingensis]|uniref:Uncharacterized protein n=1 Tax=Legionella lansingensis TaxID=45067 RepID=A0A0W0VY91_9GAMM|nr:hypothetical protein [Legionella lansingensis]KTD24979.1 hypothetical protein Llan_0284 [Legionella lansingensis]SNV48272.1 Uncharacterised protein [Legionella lansingensis]